MKLRNAIAAAALALISVPAFAGPDIVSISAISGSWVNPVPPPPAVTIVNSPDGNAPSTARWGIPATAAGQSGYDFTAVLGTVNFTVNPPPDSPQELLGTFNHLNFPIFPPNLESIELDITANVAVNAISQGPLTFKFDFTHDETPNGGPPGGPFTGSCPYPTPGSPNGVPGVNINGCADKVSVSTAAGSQTFSIGGVQYTLDILGFSQDGGLTTTDNFITTENLNNTAGLYAHVHAVTPSVPEPASLALLGLGLLAAGFVRRKSNR